MKRLLAIVSIAASVGVYAEAPPAERKAPVISAKQTQDLMQDQLMHAMVVEGQRARRLTVYGAAPHFLEISVDDGDNLSIASSFGMSYAPRRSRFRMQRVGVRVGSPALDSTGYIGSDAYHGTRFDSDLLPLDNDLNSLRISFWLSLDRSYKTAVDALSRKQAALNYYAAHDRVQDFATAPRLTLIGDAKKPGIDETRWTERVRALSAVFRGRAGVVTADAELNWSPGTFYYFNSDASGVRVPDRIATVRLRAAALAADGGEVYHGIQYAALDTAALPGDAELKTAAARTADELDALVKAPIGTPYTGPVLFESYAAAQWFAEIFGQELAVPRKPVAEKGRDVPLVESALQNKVGTRVLPTFLSMRDDATRKQWNGVALAGFYESDLEGVAPVPVPLVERGVLKDLLRTRQPIHNGEASSGHARLPGLFGAKTARPGNLIIEASESVDDAKLRKQLLDLVRQQNKPYGLIVRRMDFPSQAAPSAVRELAMRQARSGGGGRLYSAPLLVYRVYADGHEELVRGLRIRGAGVRAFRDILAAGSKPAVFSYIENGAPMALTGAGSVVVGCSVVAPAVLFEELELEPVADETARAPLVGAPVQ